MLPDAFTSETFHPREDGPQMPEIHRTWATKDGHVVMMIIEDHQFQAMCRALDREDMIDDPRCANLIQRILNAEALFAQLGAEIRKWPTGVLVERARRFGAPVAPANGVEDMMADPQVQHSGLVVEVEHPEAGTMRYLRNPVRFGRTPTSMRHHPPALGEHSDEILREAGYSEEEIGALRESGAVS
jgi:CoA:oxalate CoA-transferase